MKKLAYGMLFGMSLLVGCEPPKAKEAPAPVTEKPAADKPDEMKADAPAAEPAAPAEPAAEPKKE